MPAEEGYYHDFVHMTEEGVQVKGELFARFVGDEVAAGGR